jgi:hypothetical protein
VCICTEIRDACVGMGIVVLGVCGVKIGRRRRFGYFGGGELEATDLRSGMMVHFSVHSRLYGFHSTCVGVLLTFGGHEVATYWAPSQGTNVHALQSLDLYV